MACFVLHDCWGVPVPPKMASVMPGVTPSGRGSPKGDSWHSEHITPRNPMAQHGKYQTPVNPVKMQPRLESLGSLRLEQNEQQEPANAT